MAEGLANHFFSDKVEAYSAGTNPSKINSLAIKAMTELDIDISNQYSKNLTEFLNKDFDFAITLCSSAQEECPVFPGAKKTIHLPIKDPAKARGNEEERQNVFNNVRDQIYEKIKEFILKYLD